MTAHTLEVGTTLELDKEPLEAQPSRVLRRLRKYKSLVALNHSRSHGLYALVGGPGIQPCESNSLYPLSSLHCKYVV